jgi:hypothetical protein
MREGRRRSVAGSTARSRTHVASPAANARVPRAQERHGPGGPEGLAEGRHQPGEGGVRGGVAGERLGDGQERLERARAGLDGLEQARLIDGERGGVGEQPEDGEVLLGEVLAAGEAVGVEDADHSALDLKRHRDRRPDAPALAREVDEA